MGFFWWFVGFFGHCWFVDLCLFGLFFDIMKRTRHDRGLIYICHSEF